MRHVIAAGILASVLGCCPARAGEIVQYLQMSQQGPDGSPYGITGDSFNSSLGSLESVTATFAGNFDASIYTPDAQTSPPIVHTQVNGSLFAGVGNGFMGMDFGPIELILVGNTYVGSAQVDLASPYSFPAVAAFAGNGSLENYLLEFDFFSPLGFPDGAIVDSSSFQGMLTLTYDYVAVPEPASAVVLTIGLAVVGSCRRRRVNQSASAQEMRGKVSER